MYTGGAGGFESRCPAYGSLAQRTERRLALAGWYAQVRCLHSPREHGVFHAVRVWARPPLAREWWRVILFRCRVGSKSFLHLVRG